MPSSHATNVLGGDLQCCCDKPATGYYRDGFCHTGPQDRGLHVVCAEMTEAFLEYTRLQGNDLSTPIPAYRFAGLKPGNRWCLCVSRWMEAMRAGCAPPVVLESTHVSALEFVALEDLQRYAVR
ncbi:MAG: DUF2237 family protein [Candidatus Methylacidiphilales bacterium]